MTFGEKLQQLRAAAGLTVAQLARRADLNFGTVQSYDRGKRSPSLDNLNRLAGALGVSSLAEFDGCECPPDARKGRSGGARVRRAKAKAER